jgi:tetratricopeptide (TPR) repeat protein
MCNEQRRAVSRRKLTCIALVFATCAWIAVCAPSANAQISNFAPTKKTPSVSVRELQRPSKARDEFERGLRRLEKRDPAGSLKHFDTAIQISGDYYEVYYHRGVAELQLGKSDEALRSFQRAIDLSDGRYAPAQFGYGLILCRQDKPEEAERIIRQGLETDATIADGHVVLALVLLKLNRGDEAEKSAREALRLNDPHAAKGYLVLADVDAARRDYQAQVRDLNAYLKINRNDAHKAFLQATRDAAKRLAARTGAHPQSERPSIEVRYTPAN